VSLTQVPLTGFAAGKSNQDRCVGRCQHPRSHATPHRRPGDRRLVTIALGNDSYQASSEGQRRAVGYMSAEKAIRPRLDSRPAGQEAGKLWLVLRADRKKRRPIHVMVVPAAPGLRLAQVPENVAHSSGRSRLRQAGKTLPVPAPGIKRRMSSTAAKVVALVRMRTSSVLL
jgi:hypothetical protein